MLSFAVERRARALALARLRIFNSKTATLVAKESVRIERFSPMLGDLRDVGTCVVGQRSNAARFRTFTLSPRERARR